MNFLKQVWNGAKNLAKKAVDFVTKPINAAATATMAVAGAAQAALPTEVSTAVDTAKTDLLAAIGMVMAAMVAVWGLRKLAAKMGWM